MLGDEIWHPKCSSLRKSIRQMENFITGTPGRSASSKPQSTTFPIPKSPSSPQMTQTKKSQNLPRIPKPEPETPFIKLGFDKETPKITNGVPKNPKAEQCFTQASYSPPEANKRQVTAPVTNTQKTTSWKPSSGKPLHYAMSHKANAERDLTNNTSEFLMRLNQLKYEQSMRGKPMRPVYPMRRKMPSSRHVSLEPTIVESEWEDEFPHIDAEMPEGDLAGKGENGENSSGNETRSTSSASSTVSSIDSNDRRYYTNPANKPISQYFPYEQLRTRDNKLPGGIDRKNLEKYLRDDEFVSIFRCRKQEFYKLPKWKRDMLKKENQLF